MNHYEAYKNVIFEKEANTHECDFEYLNNRPFLNWAIEKYPEVVE